MIAKNKPSDFDKDGAALNREQSFFLKVLRDHLNRRPSEQPEGLDWDALFSIAKAHKMEGILYSQNKQYLKSRTELGKVTRLMERNFSGTIYLTSSLYYELQHVTEVFRQAGIPAVPIKAAAISQYYPEPMLRTMGDMDLLVKAEDANRISQVMETLGYSNTRWTEREWDYKKNSLCFEFQALLLHDTALDEKKSRDYLNDFWPYVFQDKMSGALLLDWNFHLLYLIAHIAKHMKSSGVGFRQFFDLAVLLVCAPELFDWTVFNDHAEKAGLLPFVKSCLTLCHIWFGVPSPLPEAELSDCDVEEITQYVFANGVFGFQNEERHSKELSRLNKKIKLPFSLLKFFVFLKLLFPSYENLCSLEKYNGLRGKPWLLPWYWINRILHGVGNLFRIKQAKTILRISKDDLKKQDHRLQILGL